MRLSNNKAGFSILELLIAMTVMLVVLGLAASLFSKSLGIRQRESSRTDALTSAQAALNVISREIANSGYGLTTNGLVLADSNIQKLHFLSNAKNTNSVTTDPGENVTYYFDSSTSSILRYDANGNGAGVPQTSIIINRISNVNFLYFDYTGSSSAPTSSFTPTINTGRVRVTITVSLEEVQGQPKGQSVVLISDVTLRNSDYMLQNY
jgi:prepilin-type N-terminal cleavage/methylation domain-containing protein